MIRSILILCAALAALNLGCDNDAAPVSASGITKASIKVPTDSEGHSIEQRNVMERLKRDNEPGAIKHLYVISSFSGDVLIYSTVKGKVTSGSKRLTPSTVQSANNSGTLYGGFRIPIGGTDQTTSEVLSDDGAYGSSGDYLYWFDARGVYHQQYASSCIIHISDQPLPIKHVVLNMEVGQAEQAEPSAAPAGIAAPVSSAKKGK